MRLFVTGTDTDVGKTFVTACLARAARVRGTVLAVKPVASGVTGTAADDAAQLGSAAGHDAVCFAAFDAPLSPHRAAALEGRRVPDDLPARLAELRADCVIVEGVGGWLVPLCLEPPLWVADLARATDGPVLVVASDRIGVLNHTLMTLAAIRADGLRPAAVALNRGPGEGDPSQRWNVEDLVRLAGVPVVPVPWLDPADHPGQQRIGASLLRAIFPPLPSR